MERLLSGLVCALALIPTAVGASTPAFDRSIADSKASMMTEPQRAYQLSQQALLAAASERLATDRKLDEATAVWLGAEALVRMKRAREALPQLDHAFAVVHATTPGAKLEADVLKSRGRAEVTTGAAQLALRDFQRAYNIYQFFGEHRSESIVLQEIGAIYISAHDFPRALEYYKQSQDAFNQDPALLLSAANNRGFALKEMGRHREAQAELRKALQIASTMRSGHLEAEVLANLAFDEALSGDLDQAKRDAIRGLSLAATNSEAASESPFLEGVFAKIAAERHDYREATTRLNRVFTGKHLETTSNDYRDFHELAAEVYGHVGDWKAAFDHLRAFKRLDDEGRDVAASTNAALMSAQFDFANQATRIAELKARQAQDSARFSLIVTIGLAVGGMLQLGIFTHAFLTMRRSRNRVRAVNQELERVNGALERASKAKTDFLATTSHEIRTPLNGVLGMTQVLLGQSLPPDVRERIELIKESGETMNAMVSDLLDVAKIEQGVLSVKRQEIDLHRLLQGAIKTWADKAAVENIELQLDMSDCPQRIVEDGDRLRQLIFNIISNAVKFTERGAVRVTAGVQTSTDGDRLRISISDTGSGIPQEQLDRIFEAFVQVDSSTQRRHAGTGLGLSICRSIAHSLGGSISVQSQLGEGSTFVIDLPLVRAQSLSGAPRDEAEPGWSLLLFEDNPLRRAMLKSVLQPRAARIEFATDLKDLAAQTAAGRCQCVLIDMACLARSAPGDSEGVLANIARTSQAPVVLLGCPRGDGETRPVEALPGVHVIPKPILPDVLVAELDRIVTAWLSKGESEAAPGRAA